jgi:hypothetical protein
MTQRSAKQLCLQQSGMALARSLVYEAQSKCWSVMAKKMAVAKGKGAKRRK